MGTGRPRARWSSWRPKPTLFATYLERKPSYAAVAPERPSSVTPRPPHPADCDLIGEVDVCWGELASTSRRAPAGVEHHAPGCRTQAAEV